MTDTQVFLALFGIFVAVFIVVVLFTPLGD